MWKLLLLKDFGGNSEPPKKLSLLNDFYHDYVVVICERNGALQVAQCVMSLFFTPQFFPPQLLAKTQVKVHPVENFIAMPLKNLKYFT